MAKKSRALLSGGILLLLLCAGILWLLHERSGGQTEPVTITDYKLNTVVSITLYDSREEELLTQAISLCDTYEKIFSRTDPDSELYQLNHRTLPRTAAGGYQVSPELAELIGIGLEYARLSEGAFDITIEPVSSLWDFTSGEAAVPSEAEISEALTHVGYEKVQIEGDTVTFADEHTRLDLGAIAKGYIADQIKEYLLSRGVGSAVINLGGNVLCIGGKPSGEPFSVGIQKPFAGRSETISTVAVSDRSVVSSGVYERYFEKNGRLYHHILNPETGYPYENGLVSVSILSDASVDGDALSTACFALGLEKGMELLNSMPDVQGIFITEDDQLHYTDGFDDAVSGS